MKNNKLRVRATNKSEVVLDAHIPITSTELDGKKVTGIHICMDLESHEDCLKMIDFLKIHKNCFHTPTND